MVQATNEDLRCCMKEKLPKRLQGRHWERRQTLSWCYLLN